MMHSPIVRGQLVHGIDQVFVFFLHEGTLQLHGGGQLLILGGEQHIDQAEILIRNKVSEHYPEI
tara:strand:- start:1101 stop:1292 length:192 start_codon:yes stop_codon:yes gene_type:complete